MACFVFAGLAMEWIVATLLNFSRKMFLIYCFYCCAETSQWMLMSPLQSCRPHEEEDESAPTDMTGCYCCPPTTA
jgi:hypothetical protein